MKAIETLLRLTAIAALTLTLEAAPTAGAQTARLSKQIAGASSTELAGSVQPLAHAMSTSGRLSGAQKLTGISLVFSRTAAQESALQTLLAAQQNPTSAQFHRWLTPEQFADRFGMSSSDIAKAESWLEAQGFTIDSVARSRNSIRFSGTAAQVEQAFATRMQSYTVGGTSRFAPATALHLPASLSGVVLAVRNLDNFAPRAHTRLRSSATARAAFTTSDSSEVYFDPADIKTAYNLKPMINAGYNGSGQTIVVLGQSAVSLSDIESFQSAAGLATKDPTVVLVPDTGSSAINPLSSGDELESDLDLEWAGAIATGATIDFVYTGKASSSGVFDALAYAVDQKLGTIISISYGACETELSSSDVSSLEYYTAEAAAQGQTIVASSGDSGSTACYGYTGSTDNGTTFTTTMDEALAVNYPASSAYATGVGGTEATSSELTIGGTYWEAASGNADSAGTLKTYMPEVAWNDDGLTGCAAYDACLSASGGGTSALIKRPSWQYGFSGIGGSATSYRLVPDVAFYSSPNYPGYLYCSSDSETGVSNPCSVGFRNSSGGSFEVAGGTSFAAPIFAGMVAILNQAKSYTAGQGLINSTLYSLASTSSIYNAVFHDTISGTNECTAGSSYCSSAGESAYATASGYDEVTGLGSIDLDALYTHWVLPTGTTVDTLTGTTTTVAASPSSTTAGATVHFTVTVASSAASVTPTGSVLLSIDGGGTEYSDSGSTATLSLSNCTTLSAAVSCTASYSTSFSTSGTHQVLATYEGDNATANSTGVAQITVAGSSGTGSGSIALSASNSSNTGTLTISRGSAGYETVKVTPSGGYTGNVLLWFDTSNDTALTNLCYAFTKTLSSGYGEVAVNSTSAVTTQLELDTKASDCASSSGAGVVKDGILLRPLRSLHAASSSSPGTSPAASHRPLLAGLLWAGVLLAGLCGARGRRVRALLGLLLLSACVLTVSSCSGGSSSNSSSSSSNPAKGSYTITVYAEDTSSSSISATTTFTLKID